MGTVPHGTVLAIGPSALTPCPPIVDTLIIRDVVTRTQVVHDRDTVTRWVTKHEYHEKPVTVPVPEPYYPWFILYPAIGMYCLIAYLILSLLVRSRGLW